MMEIRYVSATDLRRRMVMTAKTQMSQFTKPLCRAGELKTCQHARSSQDRHMRMGHGGGGKRVLHARLMCTGE